MAEADFMIEDLQRELQMDSQAMSTIIKVMERDVVRGVGEERERWEMRRGEDRRRRENL